MKHKAGQKETHSSSRKQIVQVATIGGVLLLVAVLFIVKGLTQAEDPPAVAESTAQATATLPEAVGQAQATVELSPGRRARSAATALPDELPEAQLERLLAAGQPTLAFFHSNNCVQCIKMMEVVDAGLSRVRGFGGAGRRQRLRQGQHQAAAASPASAPSRPRSFSTARARGRSCWAP